KVRLREDGETAQDAGAILEQPRQERRLPDLRQNANLLLARSPQRLGNADRQFEAAQAALEVDPLWVPGLVARAEALAALGKADEALSLFETIKDREPAARLAAARLLIARMAALPVAQRKWDLPLALLDGAPPDLRDGSEGIAIRGRILAARGEKTAAVKTLEDGCKRHPKEAALWLALADAVDDGTTSKAVTGVLDRADKALGDRIELRLARAQLEPRADPAACGRHLDNAAHEAEGKTGAARETSVQGIGTGRLARGHVAGAQRAVTGLSQLRPTDLSGWSAGFEIAAQRKSFEQLESIVEKLKKIEGEEGARWRYGRALLETNKGGAKSLAAARGWLVEVRKRRPNWGRAYVLEGFLDESEQNVEKAVRNYRAALDRGESNPELIPR